MQQTINNTPMSIIFKIINYCTVYHKIKEQNSCKSSKQSFPWSLHVKVFSNLQLNPRYTFYSNFFPGYSTAEICTLVEPYSPLLYTLLFYFMYSVQPSFHKISISTPKKVNGLISWGGWL